MNDIPVQEALESVRRLQSAILEKRLFRGYSGWARIASGLATLVAAMLLARQPLTDPWTHLRAWGVILAVAVVFNYGALAWWFLVDPSVRADPRALKPALFAVPPLAVGGLMSLALIVQQDFDLLPGVWMCLYGLAQTTYRTTLPAGIAWVGYAYIVAGGLLLASGMPFGNPWPMGTMFFLGETAGGIILLAARETQT